MFDTPVLFIIFNRPGTTRLVFEQIKKVQPKCLFVAADGPRSMRPEEGKLCEEVRDIVLSGIDWECEVKTLFHEQNLGCGCAPAEAITWFFEHVERGIILEDDCLPDSSFFFFCQELLEKYLYNENVMNISGTNFKTLPVDNNDSYYFSKYNHMWGWATWRRAWKNYRFKIFDENIKAFEKLLQSLKMSNEEQNYWKNIYIHLIENYHTWDYQWLFTVWKYNGLSITPNLNLVSNIGFGTGGTHTLDENSPFSKVATNSIKIPLNHPTSITINKTIDAFLIKIFFGIVKIKKVSLWRRIYNKLRIILNSKLKTYEKVSDFYPKELGISKKEIRRLRKSNVFNDVSVIYNSPIEITEPFWHLHSLNEIFIEEVYRFNAETDMPRIIDCGANVGLSIIYFKKRYPDAILIAFEPDKGIYDMLSKNLLSLHILDVDIVNKAVWKEDSKLQFLASGSLGGKIYTSTNNKPQAEIYNIESVRLKSYLNSTVDFLKIDIEGAEFEVIKDCKDVLHNVKNLFIEYHSDPYKEQSISELLHILTQAGFRIYIKEAWNNLPYPFLHKQYKPCYDMQLNIFAYRI